MRVLLAVLLFGLAAPAAVGQTIWSRPYEPNQIVVEALAPTPFAEGASLLSGAAFITGTHSFTDHVEFVAELPVARTPASDPGASTALGNPYVGLGLSSTTAPVLVEVGARLPVASSAPALHSGAAADVGRTRAFRADEMSLSALLNGRFTTGRSSTLRLRAGGTYASFSPSDTTAQRTEQDWRFQYSLQYWHEGEALVLGLSFTGQTLLPKPGNETAKNRQYLVGSVMGNGNTAQPGLLVGISLENLGDATLLVGLTLSVSYGR